MVSNLVLQQKETGLLGDMGGSRTKAENIPDEPGSKKVPQTKPPSQSPHKGGSTSKGHQGQLEELPSMAKVGMVSTAKINKVIFDYNSKDKMSMCESGLIKNK